MGAPLPKVPPSHDTLARYEQECARLRAFAESAEALGLTQSEMEREIGVRGQHVLCALLQGWVDLKGLQQVQGPVVDAGGTERTRKREQGRPLETIFGTIQVTRTGFGAHGVKERLRPLDAHLNLPPERYSLEVRRRVAEAAAKNSFDEVRESLDQTGAHVPKRQVEELVVRAAQDFEPFYNARREEHKTPLAPPGSLVVISHDTTGVPMHLQDLRPATRKAAEKQQRKLESRLSKGEKRNRSRMASIAILYTVAPYVRTPEQAHLAVMHLEDTSADVPPRPKPQDKRVLASLRLDPREVLDEVFRDAVDRDPHGQHPTAAVVDGNEHQLQLLESLAAEYLVDLTIILDIYHVSEYVWAAGRVFAPEGSHELQAWVSERMLAILRGEAFQVAVDLLKKRGHGSDLEEAHHKPLDSCVAYLLNHLEYLAYDRYLAAGMPIASGVVEGACRYIVKDRFCRTGARWCLDGAEAVLRLRALVASGDFDEYWRFHEAREYQRHHAALYAHAHVPGLAPLRLRSQPKAPHLHLLK